MQDHLGRIDVLQQVKEGHNKNSWIVYPSSNRNFYQNH